MKLLYEPGKSWHEAKFTLDWYKHAETKLWLALTLGVSIGGAHHSFILVLRGVEAFMKERRRWEELG